MRSPKPILALLLAALATSVAADSPDGRMTSLPEYHAEDPDAAVVTEANLLASERFWPYQVALTRPWQPAGRGQPLLPGLPGVLIRIETSGLARIDFGRDGLYDVAVGETDLVERANLIRRGELEKLAPNFLLSIGPRLVDSASTSLRPLGYAAAAEPRGFLCVFADPDAGDFGDLATALGPLRERHGMLTVLFPQGEHPDARVREQLRVLEWTVPFVYDHLAEAYTRSLLGEPTPLPTLVLFTREGRVLFRSGPRAEPGLELISALDEGLGRAPATSPPPSSAGSP